MVLKKKLSYIFKLYFFPLKILGSFSVVVFCDLVFFLMKSCCVLSFAFATARTISPSAYGRS